MTRLAALWDREGGGMTWMSPEYNWLHHVDPYLFELGWQAWLWLVEEMWGTTALTAPEFAHLFPSTGQESRRRGIGLFSRLRSHRST